MWFTLHSELMGPSISAGALATPVGSFLPAPCALCVCKAAGDEMAVCVGDVDREVTP